MNFFKNIFTINALEIEPESPDFRQAYFINAMGLIGTFVFFSFALINYYVIDNIALVPVNIISFLMMAPIFYSLRKQRNLTLSSNIIIFVLSTSTLALIYIERNLNYALFYTIFIPAVSIFLKGKKTGIIISSIYIFCIIIYAYSGLSHWEPAQYNLNSFINIVAILSVNIALLVYYEKSRSIASEA